MAQKPQQRKPGAANNRLSLARAFQIIEDYATVLQRAPATATGVPRSLLPHPPQTIRAAIVGAVHSGTPPDGMSFWALEDAYARLATFIADDEAADSALGQLAIISGDPDHPQKAHVPTTLRVKREIRQQKLALLDEFRRLCDVPERG